MGEILIGKGALLLPEIIQGGLGAALFRGRVNRW